LAVLRSLHKFREKEALRRDRPPFKIFSDAVIVSLAASPSSDLAQVKGIGRYGSGSASSGVSQAIRHGQKEPPVKRPQTRLQGDRRFSSEERTNARERLRLLKGWRAGQADRLKLDVGSLWPAASLERLSRRPDGFEEELESDEVRRWQRGELGESLRKFLECLDRGEQRPFQAKQGRND
jgi:ribonuclease D